MIFTYVAETLLLPNCYKREAEGREEWGEGMKGGGEWEEGVEGKDEWEEGADGKFLLLQL